VWPNFIYLICFVSWTIEDTTLRNKYACIAGGRVERRESSESCTYVRKAIETASGMGPYDIYFCGLYFWTLDQVFILL
jgi:hypothetical protein